MKSYKYLLQFVSFGIALILVISHFIQVFFLSIVESVQYAFVCLSIISVLIGLKNKYWKYVYLGCVLVSFTGLIEFYSRIFWIEIGPIRIELTALVLLVTHLYFNPEILRNIKQKFKESEDVLVNKERLEYENKVNRFVKKFTFKSKLELEQIINENKLIPEAIEASKRLLKKQG